MKTLQLRPDDDKSSSLWADPQTLSALWGSKSIPVKPSVKSKQKPFSEQIRQVEKMEAIGTLASGIAHNFNNLLMGIQGNASLARINLEEGHPAVKMLSNIEKMVESGAKLTRQLLNYAREKTNEIAPLNLNKIVCETSETFGITRKEIRIHLDLDHNLKDVNADQGQIEQVLLNLYVNAGDAMPQGGDLFIKTRNLDGLPENESQKNGQNDPYVLLEVQDTGVGLDEATQKRIFEPFFTTKGLEDGTGLGLSSAYGIIESHGGHIDVTSAPGAGSTFSIFLPELTTTTSEVAIEDQVLLTGGETILLVDDEELVLEIGAELLESLGYTVIKADGGREALERYLAKKDEIDMVILDMILPDMDGGETFDQLKAASPKLKVLLSSGYGADGKAAEIINRGCDGFIQKPFKMQEISQKIREILDRP